MLETWGSVCSRGFVVGLCFMLLCSHSVYHDDLIVDQSLDTEQIQTSAPEDELTQTLSLQTRLTSQQLSFWPAKSWHKEILEIPKPPEEKKTSSLSFSEDTNKSLSVVLLVWSTACAQCAFRETGAYWRSCVLHKQTNLNTESLNCADSSVSLTKSKMFCVDLFPPWKKFPFVSTSYNLLFPDETSKACKKAETTMM